MCPGVATRLQYWHGVTGWKSYAKRDFYEHGTHFAFPQSMLDIMMPVIGNLFVGLAFKAGRKHPKECKQTRLDIDRKLAAAIKEW